MAATITFDTLKYVKSLKAAGFDERQAEALAEIQIEISDKTRGELVTKEYLDARSEKDLSPIRTDLAVIKWMLALIIIVTVLPALKSLLG
ncbi:MAG: DUF1640 domain-containing protein [Magnetococcales bacterium]|nr:DUF1640 domain-containing protein [Magnetococcales bacterium]